MTDGPLHWRTSSYTGSSGTCVEVARLADGHVLVRNSNHPDAGTLRFTPAEMTGWLAGCKAGELDELTD
jgi:hypothetical protein